MGVSKCRRCQRETTYTMSGLCRHCWERKPCLHCGGRGSRRPRGLCWSCYMKPEVRCQYESGNKHGRRGVQTETNGKQQGRLADEPTEALPGSPAKELVIAARLGRGEALFHPFDARINEE